MERMMGEGEWALHNEWLRKEELERYKQSKPPTTVPKVSRVLNREQEAPPFGVATAIVVCKSELLVGSERPPAAAQ